MYEQILGFSRVRVRVRVSIRVSLVCASTLDNNVATSAESMFVRTENSVIQRLILAFSVIKDGNQALNLAIFRPSGLKIAKFNCKYPSIWTENSVYMCVNFRPYGWKIANSYT